MLIKALSDYYDIMAKAGKVRPDGYSGVKVSYVIALTRDGIIDDILDIRETVQVPAGKGKTKERKVPRELIMPQRTEKSAIDVNFPEHRPLYIFGLNLDKGNLTPYDRTEKARKSHEEFVKRSLDFFGEIASDTAQAFCAFLKKWNPEQETENRFLLNLGKDYAASGYAFCLSGAPDHMLHDDPAVKEKWNQEYAKRSAISEDVCVEQCAVTGQNSRIARIHGKIKGIYGGAATGNNLIGFNNASENSYGNDQSYNSCISEDVMKKYTEALNYLLSGVQHKAALDELTIVFWAMDADEGGEEAFRRMLFGQSDQNNAEETERLMKSILKAGASGNVTERYLTSAGRHIASDVDFYMIGIKPNVARLSLKFIVRKRFADILWNIAAFQRDIQISEEFKVVPLYRITGELISPKSSNDKPSPALEAALLEAIITGNRFPVQLLETLLRRVRTDENGCNQVRIGLIRAYINRFYKREVFQVELNKNDTNQGYLCGRLFAVLERLQQAASNYTLNRTIRDTYFASANTRPILVFPRLIVLSNYHMAKLRNIGKANYETYFKNLILEIAGKIEGNFPQRLSQMDQGAFDIGYLHQCKDMDNNKKQEKETEKAPDIKGDSE